MWFPFPSVPVVTEALMVAPEPGQRGGARGQRHGLGGEHSLSALPLAQLQAVVGQDPDLPVPQLPYPQHGVGSSTRVAVVRVQGGDAGEVCVSGTKSAFRDLELRGSRNFHQTPVSW